MTSNVNTIASPHLRLLNVVFKNYARGSTSVADSEAGSESAADLGPVDGVRRRKSDVDVKVSETVTLPPSSIFCRWTRSREQLSDHFSARFDAAEQS